MRRTRIKGIANIPQRKRTEPCQKIEENQQKTVDIPRVKEQTENANQEKNAFKTEDSINEICGNIDLQVESKSSRISSTGSKIEQSNKDSTEAIVKVQQTYTKQLPEELVKDVPESENLKPHDVDNEKSISQVPAKSIDVPGNPDNFTAKTILKLEKSAPQPPVDATAINLKSLEIRTKSTSFIGSDSEYPAPPASPSKLNRNRIKAVPRLGYRKISFSASESEDESKRGQYRTRNDSQSSNVSAAPEIPLEQPATPKVKEFSSVIHRKCKRTEWSRKLADARRQFNKKFSVGTPDHKSLTMMDLIFYNPSTNPMKKDNQRTLSTSSHNAIEAPLESEKVDDPSEMVDDPPENGGGATAEPSDEENDIPAPQIKIGPSGEIILDDQSLVIESKQTKKDREQLQKSELVDGNTDKAYGVFKRVKRSKDWNHTETLMFYRALSSIGTDFSLMCDLFPKRNRRELKMKFKKEERLNRGLVDKALMQPCNFDFEELKKEFELFEKEREELLRQKRKEGEASKKNTGRSIKFLNYVKEKDEGKKIPDKLPAAPKGKRKKIENEEQKEVEKEVRKKIVKIVKRRKPNRVKLKEASSDSDSINSDDDSFDFRREQITRYGRQVRRREVYEPNLEVDVVIPRKVVKRNVENPPGSLMMVSKTGENGEDFVQIFMVTDKNSGESRDNLVPIAMIKTDKTDDEEEIVENNVTIPAGSENSVVEHVENLEMSKT